MKFDVDQRKQRGFKREIVSHGDRWIRMAALKVQ